MHSIGTTVYAIYFKMVDRFLDRSDCACLALCCRDIIDLAQLLRLPLESYQDGHLTDLIAILFHRIDQHPFNLIATLLFACAICHTFLTGTFRRISHRWEHESRQQLKSRTQDDLGVWHDVRFGSQVMHFLGEVEVVFGLWILPLLAVAFYFFSWDEIVSYVNGDVNYTEAMFVVVIMALASSRPVVKLAENSLQQCWPVLAAILLLPGGCRY